MKPILFIQKLIDTVKRLPSRFWLLSLVIIAAIGVGTTGALSLKNSFKEPKLSVPIAAAPLAKTVSQPIEQKKVAEKPEQNSGQNIKQVIDVDPPIATPPAYEEQMPEEVLEPLPPKSIASSVTTPTLEPVIVPPEFADTWRKNAVQLKELPPGPQIAIVIDDAGIDRRRTKAAINLPAPITIAFLTYARDLPKQAAAAVTAGHETIVHMAMEPMNKAIDPGPNVLLSENNAAAILKKLTWGLERFSGYVGINNHMGSRFTADPVGMNIVMRELKRRGLLFLDSRTSGSTVAPSIALANDVPFTQRNIFLDNVPTVEAVNKQLALIEKFAKRYGHAVAIGHPRDATIQALAQWLAVIAEKGFVQVPISAIVARQRGIEQVNLSELKAN